MKTPLEKFNILADFVEDTAQDVPNLPAPSEIRNIVKPTAEQAIEANRTNLAFDLADVLWRTGWTPAVDSNRVEWPLAVQSTGRPKRDPSAETKLLTWRILDFAYSVSEAKSKK